MRTDLSDFARCNLTDYTRVKQRGGIAELFPLTFCNLAQDATHDLPAPRLGQARYKLNLVWLRNGTDNPGYSLQNIPTGQLFITSMVSAKQDKGIYALTLDVVRIAHHCTLYHASMHVDGILDFSGANPMSTYIEHVIHSARNPVITLPITQRAITSEV